MTLFIVEARVNGALCLDEDKQPPFRVASYNQLYDYYCANKGAGGFTREDVYAWYESKGWYIRQRTW